MSRNTKFVDSYVLSKIAKIFTHFREIAIFVLGRFILTHPVFTAHERARKWCYSQLLSSNSYNCSTSFSSLHLFLRSLYHCTRLRYETDIMMQFCLFSKFICWSYQRVLTYLMFSFSFLQLVYLVIYGLFYLQVLYLQLLLSLTSSLKGMQHIYLSMAFEHCRITATACFWYECSVCHHPLWVCNHRPVVALQRCL